MFSEAKARRVTRFIECLKQTKGEFHGKPFKLLPWQEKVVRDVFGTVRDDDPTMRQYNTAYIEIPKKNGKSELGAAIALNMLCNDDEWRAEVYSCASDRQQAAIVFDVAVDMVKQSPALSRRIKIIPSTKRMVFQPTGSIYQVLSSEVATKHGLNVSACIFDELHTQPTRALYDVMTQGSGDARKQPLWFLLTTAGTDRNSICWEVHQKALDIIEGRKDDPRFYPVLFGLPDDADWTDERNWYRANPSLDKTISIDKVRDAFRKAQETPADENMFRQLRLNQWVKQSVRWMPMDKWDECGGAVKEIERLERQAAIDRELDQPTASLLVSRPTAPTDRKQGRASDEYRNAFWGMIRSRTAAPSVMNALQIGTDTEGGFLVPDEYERTLVRALEEENVLRSLCTIIQTSSGDRKIPVVASHGTASWVDEEGAIPESDEVFGQITIGAHKVATMIKVSDELLQDSVFNIESYIAAEFARRIGAAEEDAFINGDGTGKPTGLLHATNGAGTGVTTAGATIAADEIIDLVHSITGLPEGFRTGNMPSNLNKTGAFTELTGSKYQSQSTYLGRGDILVTKTNGHTVVVLTNGSKYEGTIRPVEYTLGDRTIKYGCEGQDVKLMQEMLLKLGYDLGSWGIDGDFGDCTDLALRAFQKDARLDVDGECGPATLVALEKAVEALEDAACSGDSCPINVTIVGGNCYIRTAPNTDGKILGVAHKGDTLPYGGQISDGGWLLVQHENQNAWVSGKYGKIG